MNSTYSRSCELAMSNICRVVRHNAAYPVLLRNPVALKFTVHKYRC